MLKTDDMRTLKPPDKIKADTGLLESRTPTTKDVAINAGVGEVRLEGGFGGSPTRTVFMYSATTTPGETGVTLQLREPETSQEKTKLNSVLARIQQEEVAAGSMSINYHDPEIITDGSIDVLLSANTVSTAGGESGSSGFEMFESESGQELTLSPQTFANTEAFINDSSGSPGVDGPDNDTVESSEEGKASSTDSSKLTVKKPRPKATSPNRQGPQKCPVCNKVFGNASALAKHKLTHSDERKYVCSMCGKAFKRQDHLNGHMLTHRNKKPYECKAEGCGKSYCDARSLRRHTENHHAGIASSTTPSPGSREDGSPQSCIQYAPPPSYNSAAVSAPSGNSVNGQAKPVSQLQQLLASEPVNTSGPFSSKSSNNQSNNDGLTKQQIDLIHQIMQQTQQQAMVAAASSHPKCSTVSSMATTTTTSTKQKSWTVQNNATLSRGTTCSKPVECNLCHRKFKNIPALNGHMRLHGGYFKKDSDAKKCEKKDISGPPLQTASMSVRALIEEKIIQKRTNPTQTPTTNMTAPQPTDQTSVNESTTFCNGASPEREFNVKTTASVLSTTPTSTVNDKVATKQTETIKLEPNLNPTTKVDLTLVTHIQRPSIDHPILRKSPKLSVKRASSDPGLLQPSITETARQLQLNLPTDPSYSLGVYSEDAGYFSPTLQDDVFQQVDSVQESMILQGVDPTRLAESIKAATLQDIASLEGYTSPTESISSPQSFQRHQDLQSVLDSPLPISLADFAYAHSQHGNNESTLPSQPPYVTSPLPSPCFTYPTPPASQESPSFPPLQPVLSGNISSPLSAAFFTTTMSSSAAVEAALNEVLPQHNYPSTPSQSPIPDASPLPTPASATSPLPHHPLQSQMMSNSDDPLLSSSPKDFASRKKFDFHTFKLIHNGTIDFGSGGPQGVTGIVLDRNGELKLIQTSCFQTMKSGLLNGTAVYLNTKRKADSIDLPENKTKIVKTISIPAKTLTASKLYKANGILLEPKDEPIEDDVFLNPSIPTSPIHVARKRIRLDISASMKPPYQSRLRKARKTEPDENLSYTASPILPPIRYGQGLFWQAVTVWPSSTTLKVTEEAAIDMKEPLYESDATPHINVGPEYQCEIPPCLEADQSVSDQQDQLLWKSSLNEVSNDNEIDMYLEFACCAAVPGGGRNKEYALHILHLCRGKIHEAMLKLMQPTPCLPAIHPLLSFEYTDSERWTSNEMDAFQQALFKFDKDFLLIAQEIGSKTPPQCVQFYYIWKKVCPEDYKKLRMIRKRFRDCDRDVEIPKSEITVNDAEMVSTSSESRLFVCEYADCSASFNSRAALNGHIRIHVGGTSGRSPTPDKRNGCISQPNSETSEEFPCKICGKIFNKVKSRSAHMKSHRPPDAEARKLKTEATKIEGTEQPVGKDGPVSSTNLNQRNS